MAGSSIKVCGLGKYYRLGQKRPPLWSGLWSAARGDEAQGEKGLWALRDISFDVSPGEIVGVVGANGAGKSTLLKILSRIVTPSRGEAFLQGRMRALLEVGTGFHPDLTGRENVVFNGILLGMKRHEIRARFDAIVAFAGVERFIDTPVKHYSSGMAVRLAFAIGAHLDPEILIVDEVLAVGDASFQQKCLGKMQEVARSGRTILFVSHNSQAIRRLCTRALFLEQGQLVADGDVHEVLDRYLKSDHGIERWQGAIDALARPHERYGTQARMTGLWFLGEGPEQETTTLAFGETLSLVISVQGNENLRGLHLVVGIDDDQTQTRILTANSAEEGWSFGVDTGACRQVRLDMPQMKLQPGTYRLSLALYAGTACLDRLLRCQGFSVKVTSNSTLIAPISEGAGFLRANAQWALQDRLPEDVSVGDKSG